QGRSAHRAPPGARDGPAPLCGRALDGDADPAPAEPAAAPAIRPPSRPAGLRRLAAARRGRHPQAQSRELLTVKKRRILLLVNEGLIPPEDLRGISEDQIEACRTEYNVLSTLANNGHEVRVLGIGDKIGELRRVIRDWRPEITFNLLEEFSGIATYDHYVVTFLELMRQPYTGCNPRGMMLSRDKVLTKQILAYHRIPTPRFHLFPWGRSYREPRKLEFP